MVPKIIKGNCHQDSRGSLFFNNNFDAARVKRTYVIENRSPDLVRGWRGHRVEERWFSAISGSFVIELIALDDWENPSRELDRVRFVLSSETLDLLHIPAGYVSSIQSLECRAKLLVMADYKIGEIDDEYRFDVDYFT